MRNLEIFVDIYFTHVFDTYVFRFVIGIIWYKHLGETCLCAFGGAIVKFCTHIFAPGKIWGWDTGWKMVFELDLRDFSCGYLGPEGDGIVDRY